jgi:competence protein ComEC
VALSLATALALLVPGSPLRGRSWPPQDWLLAACDVGQGDGLALADGPGAAIVVDTGPDPDKMDGCLTDLGVHRIPLLVLTHFFLGQFSSVS